MHIKSALDFLTHGVGPGLGPKNAHLQATITRIEALNLEFVQNRERIGWGHRDALGFEIVDQSDLSRCHSARYWNRGQAKRIGPKVNAKPAGKQPVSICIVQQIARLQSPRTKRACNNSGPVLQVTFGIAHNRWLSGCPRRGMDACNLIAWHSEHAKWIVVPKILLDGERKLGKVRKAMQVMWMHTCRIKAGGVVGYVGIGVGQ